MSTDDDLDAATQAKLQREVLIAASVPDDAPAALRDLQRELIRANRYDRPISLVIIGLDLTHAEERSGLQVRANNLIRKINNRAAAVLRQSDLFGRLDAASVLVGLPETDEAGATTVLKKLLAGAAAAHLIRELGSYGVRVYAVAHSVGYDDLDIAEALDRLAKTAPDALDALR